jgi:hypothetical protein
MASMADITVKKNDGTTDIVFAAKVPSSGDTVNALWRSDANAAPYPGLKPEFKLSSRWNADKTARRLDFVGTYHSYYTDSATTVSSKLGTIVFTGSVAIPQQLPSADINEGVSQLTNLLVSTLVRTALKEGFAPT